MKKRDIVAVMILLTSIVFVTALYHTNSAFEGYRNVVIDERSDKVKFQSFKEVVTIEKQKREEEKRLADEKRKQEEQRKKELEELALRPSRGLLNEEEYGNYKRVTFIVTFYSDVQDNGIGGGATGYKGDVLKDGDVALPKDIPYLSKVIFDGDDKVYTKRDTGGAIKWINGMCHIDIFKKGYSTEQLNRLGKKYIQGYIFYKQ